MEANESEARRDDGAAAAGCAEGVTCAVCLESKDFVVLPCCGGGTVRETSTTRFCQPCIEVICRMGGGIGTCPRCRGRLEIKDGQVAVPPSSTGQCRMCRQGPLQLADRGLCHPCLAGSSNPLRYMCQRCHRTQRMAHPLYRYQPTPAEYSTATWACHQGCNDYTNWRVMPSMLARIPMADRPASWGTEDWLDEVRRARRQERRAEGRCVCA